MDFKLFIDSLATGTPIAILAAVVGVLWQWWYVRSRDKLHDEQMRRELGLELQKFEYQKQLEMIRFEYEQRQWREELAREMALKTVEVRIEEYAALWSRMAVIAVHTLGAGLTTESARELATDVMKWRYGKGGLLAAETTREAAYALQTALWEYDGSKEKQRNIRAARRLVRQALRADIGLGEDYTGQTIFEASEKVQKIQKAIEQLKPKLGIDASEM